MSRIYLATTNPGKVREFREAAQALSIALDPLPRMAEVPPAVEDGTTFEQNARIKAEYYSHLAPGELVLAEDSGLAVDVLNGAPGVHSARYAAVLHSGLAPDQNSDDQANNAALIAQLKRLNQDRYPGKYVCVIANCSPWRAVLRALGTTRCFTSLLLVKPLRNFPWSKNASIAIAARHFASSWIGIESSRCRPAQSI
jgi:non-canonical purine NTP pyrophosphatase (RdgB/HAM1 family)